MKQIKTIFMGTAEIGVGLLEQLAGDDRFEVGLVVTQEDKPAGRKMELKPSAIKVAASKLGVETFQPDKVNSMESLERIKEVKPDMIVVMAYGQILSEELLSIPAHCLNIHTSLLPKYRGASPIQTSLLNRDEKTGVSLMKMVKKMDAGAVYKQLELNIDAEETAASLHDKLAKLTANNVPELLVNVFEGKFEAVEQDEGAVSFCHKISKADGLIDWGMSALDIDARIRAFYPWPGSYTYYEGKRLKLLSAMIHNESTEAEVGTVVEMDAYTGILCKDGLIEPENLQLEGRAVQNLAEFLNGNKGFVGSRLGGE